MEHEQQKARRRIAQIAREMLLGRTDLIDGCRSVMLFRHNTGLTDVPAFDTITAIESETDDYPIGRVREEYSPELLKKLDTEIADYLNRVRPVLLSACEQLVTGLESAEE